MTLTANRTNLKRFARDLLGNEYSPEKEKQLIAECLNGFVRDYGHISHSHARHLDRIGAILNTHGTEGFIEGGKDVQYCNTGDTYALTVMYVNGKLKLGDWGSIVEAL